MIGAIRSGTLAQTGATRNRHVEALRTRPSSTTTCPKCANAHGHPIGASGAILITKAAHALHRTGRTKAVVSLRFGGGQGIALCLEQA